MLLKVETLTGLMGKMIWKHETIIGNNSGL